MPDVVESVFSLQRSMLICYILYCIAGERVVKPEYGFIIRQHDIPVMTDLGVVVVVLESFGFGTLDTSDRCCQDVCMGRCVMIGAVCLLQIVFHLIGGV